MCLFLVPPFLSGTSCSSPKLVSSLLQSLKSVLKAQMVARSSEFQFCALGHVPVIINSDKSRLIFLEVQLKPNTGQQPEGPSGAMRASPLLPADDSPFADFGGLLQHPTLTS